MMFATKKEKQHQPLPSPKNKQTNKKPNHVGPTANHKK